MKKSNRKGFTIVELVIVIAVIAILAAVLIPTFSNLIKKANISNDTAVAKNMNTALQVEGIDGAVNDIYDVINALTDYGFVLANINTKAEGCLFVWEQETNQILLVDASKGYKVLFAAKEGYGDIDASWYFVINDTGLAESVRTAQPNANVLSFFETPSAAVIETPMNAVFAAIGNKADSEATDGMYVEIPTNGASITELKIGDKTYTAEDNFKLSIGSDKFVTFNYFTVKDGKTYLAAPVVGFDAQAKYGVINNTLVMDSGVEGASVLTEDFVANKGVQLQKNDKGQYVVNVKIGDATPLLAVNVPGVTLSDKYIIKKGTGSYSVSAADDLTNHGADVGFWSYPFRWQGTIVAEDDGAVYTYSVYFVGKGYLNIEFVINVSE